jgi:hypothetical protein
VLLVLFLQLLEQTILVAAAVVVVEMNQSAATAALALQPLASLFLSQPQLCQHQHRPLMALALR